MKMMTKTWCIMLLATASLLYSHAADAALIRIETDKQQYQVGEKVTAFLKLSDAGSLLSGFFLNLQYQPSQLGLLSWSFGQAFNDGLGSYQYSHHDALNGILGLDDYADPWAEQSILATHQLGSFTLARLELTALATGQFSLDLDPSYLGLLTFNGDLFQPQWLAAHIEVVGNPAAVPATPALALLLGGLLCMAVQRRHQ